MKQSPRASNVRRMRESRCWTQEELARAAGVDVRTVQRAESGRALGIESLRALAAAFDTVVEALSVSDEELTQVLAQFHRDYSVIPLTPLESGAALGLALGECSGQLLHRGPDLSEPQRDVVAELEQDLQDWGDLWSGLEPLQRREAEKTFDGMLQGLRRSGLAISIGTQRVVVAASTIRNDPGMRLSILYTAVVTGQIPLSTVIRRKDAAF